MPLIASFLDTHRGIRIELVLTNTYLHLIEEGFDVAVRLGPLSDSGLVARRVGQAREVLLASPNYLAQRGRLRTPRDLAKHDVVFNSIRPTPLAWRFRVSGRDRTVSLTPKIIVSDTEAMLLAVRAGLGIGRALSYQAADDLSSGSLVRLLREFELPARPIYLVVPAARDMPLRVRAFLDHAVRTLGAVRVLHD
jgi:DNA-binding transcriptional LysR family regulator